MEDLISFFFIVVGVSLSGVISPGPLFAANITQNIKKNQLAGIKIALGHTAIEFPLVFCIGLGTISLGIFPEFKTWIAFAGAISLFGFSILHVIQIFKKSQIKKIETSYGALLSGIIFTGLNPFFFLWWLTIGFKLISDAMIYWSISGILIMFLMHIWLDYLWLGGTGVLISKTRNFISNKMFKLITIGLSGVMFYYGILFLMDGLTAV